MIAILVLLAAVVPPVDEAPKDASFVEFRTRLLDALRAKDRAFVESLIAPEAKVSFGGDSGAEGFSRVYPKGEEPWAAWERMLSLGGRFQKTETGMLFTAPYVFTDFPKDLDGIQSGAATVERLNVRSTPSSGKVVDQLNYETFEWLDGEPRKAWRRIRTPRGRTGYVSAQYTWSPASFRVTFAKRSQDWKIIFLAQGD